MTLPEHPLRLLLVEDDEDDFLLIRDLLAEAGDLHCVLEWVDSFERGRLAIDCGAHDLYLIDNHLGADSGLELVRHAAARGVHQPLILLTGQDDSDLDARALELGASDYLVKGQFDSRLLARSIRYALERSSTRERLERSNSRASLLQRCLEASYNGVLIVDALAHDQPIIYANPAFERITGYREEEVLGRNCRFLQGLETRQSGIAEIRRSLAERREVHVVLRNFRKDGSAFWNDLYIAPVPDERGVVTHYIGVQNDISERKRFESELAYNASHDVLTGLPNRSLLEDRLQQGCQIARRYSRELAVMLIDLDANPDVLPGRRHRGEPRAPRAPAAHPRAAGRDPLRDAPHRGRPRGRPGRSRVREPRGAGRPEDGVAPGGAPGGAPARELPGRRAGAPGS